MSGFVLLAAGTLSTLSAAALTYTLKTDSCSSYKYIFDKTGILLRHEEKVMALLRGFRY